MTTVTDAAIALRQAAACEDTYVSPGMALILVDAVEPIIRADERAKALTLPALRAKVLGLPRVTDDYYREAVLLDDVLALFGEEKL